MSSADTSHSRRAALRLLLAAALPVALGGCLRPMYGPDTSGASIVTKLEGIIVDDVPDRLGHYLVQEVRFQLDGSGGDTKPVYRLAMTATETVQSSIVNTSTGRATAATIIVRVNYTLTEIATAKVLLSQSAYTTASYERGPQRFESVRAARDAEIRAAKQLADQIRTRLSAWFATRTS